MKGLFRKALGIAAVFAVPLVVVMVALSPRGEGFFPGLLDRETGAAETVETIETVETPAADLQEPRSERDTLEAEWSEPLN